jgi:hypothetical protein
LQLTSWIRFTAIKFGYSLPRSGTMLASLAQWCWQIKNEQNLHSHKILAFGSYPVTFYQRL